MSIEVDRVERADEARRGDPVAEKVEEGLHLAGSTIVTGGVAVLLAVIAIPVSIGLGAAWAVRSTMRRLRGGRS